MGKKKYFTTIKRGEISEWKKELVSTKENIRKEAVKKIVAAMTSGKDVGMLFTDVINCSQTNNVELKKLVYLYMMNYAPQNSQLAILAVSSLVKDFAHPNSLIRGLALRTMSGIGVDEIFEYLTEPLKSSLKDPDPYVRKIAALSVCKYFIRSPTQAIENGLVEDLEKLLRDSNSMVVSNAVVSLCEISRHSDEIELKFTQKTIKTLLLALNLSAEWSQISILDTLSTYKPFDNDETDMIIEKVLPRIQHTNPGVVMACVKVVLNMWDSKGRFTDEVLREKIKKPLLTLVSIKNQPEIVFAVMKNIRIILGKFPLLMENEVKYFFCSYDDPLCLKLEKLELLSQLVTDKNVEVVLLELRDYVNEVDIEFVRKSILTIGSCAMKLKDSVSRCIPILIDIINTKVDYSVETSVIVLRRIVQNYPKKFTKVFRTISENLNILEEDNAKISMIWLLAEYYDLIENAQDVLKVFVNHFNEQSESVQFQLLNSFMKIYVKHKNDVTKNLFETLLTHCTDDSVNYDLRDMSYLYYRMIGNGVGKRVVEKELPPMMPENLSQSQLQRRFDNFTRISSIVHKDPKSFVSNYMEVRIKSSMSKDDESLSEEESEGQMEETNSSKKMETSKSDEIIEEKEKELLTFF